MTLALALQLASGRLGTGPGTPSIAPAVAALAVSAGSTEIDAALLGSLCLVDGTAHGTETPDGPASHHTGLDCCLAGCSGISLITPDAVPGILAPRSIVIARLSAADSAFPIERPTTGFQARGPPIA